ncbi:MAG TPA: DNA-directed RNA polymerase subunit alpha [Pirellulaceae bacterium]|nr:DNA-directed RNA polymerase subunit alpha [Pirellulaceae bacterium]HMO90843.1 DNA-directed RNA polymerase subunit alpha [Pirellulaceae bacterium]HMP68681.1 DNA-directed RNA polymerase subunit alpha [Pirellulaceae bacterium]
MHIRWRGLELPNIVQCDQATLTSTYGKFVAEPFERGFGTTIGNSLRRILLSSLEGSAVTQVKFRGANHEFTTIDGVMEDVTDIVLNVKSLVVKNLTDQMKIIIVEKNTAGPITGADIQTGGEVKIINPQHKLAELTVDKHFMMEMVVENGRGYIPASEHSPHDHEIGIIPVDAVYSPVTKVRYTVDETRVGQRTNYDKLTLEIWTDGSITPEFALVEASKILRKHLNPFVQYSELGPRVFSHVRQASGLDVVQESRLNMPISELRLSVRASNCLANGNIATVRELVRLTEDQLLDLKNFGETTLAEIADKLQALGLRLGMRVPAAPAIR